MLYQAVPLEVERIWGALRNEKGFPVGEIWYIYHNAENSSRIISVSDNSDTSIADLIRKKRLPSRNNFFPLLIKTLHTSEVLSVQVHPGAHGENRRKDETWYVMDAASDAWMLCGMKKSVTAEILRKSSSSSNMESCFLKHSIGTGDFIHLQAGCVHALGPGISVLEIQLNDDITYRLYDWGRTGFDGKPRELHVEEALKSIDWERSGKCFTPGVDPEGYLQLMSCDYSIRVIRKGTHSFTETGIVFLVSGELFMGSDKKPGLKPPACIISDSDGGIFRIDGLAMAVEMTGKQ